MRLNAVGAMIQKWCLELPNKFPYVAIDVYTIMPNHFHAIITSVIYAENQQKDTLPCVPLSTVVQWFKTMTTNEYIRGVKTLVWESYDKRLWQRNYHEHIIRTRNSYQFIANYIKNNPSCWAEDTMYEIKTSIT